MNDYDGNEYARDLERDRDEWQRLATQRGEELERAEAVRREQCEIIIDLERELAAARGEHMAERARWTADVAALRAAIDAAVVELETYQERGGLARPERALYLLRAAQKAAT